MTKRRFKKSTQDDINKIFELREQGLSSPEIGKIMNKHHTTILYFLNGKAKYEAEKNNKRKIRNEELREKLRKRFKKDDTLTYAEILQKQLNKDESKMSFIEKYKYQKEKRKVREAIRFYNVNK